MFKKLNTKIELIFTKLANHNHKIHSFFNEWRPAILTVYLVRILTSGVSIFSGYFYFNSIIYPLLNNQFLTALFSILFLLSLEIMTAVFLYKSFKFFLRKDFKTVVMPLVAAVGLFTISFIVSTNGLAMQQSDKANQTVTISDKYSVQTIAINQKFENQISEIKNQITTIENNPSDWRSGKRDVLSSKQLNKIDSLYNVIALLNSDLKSEITEMESLKSNELSTNTIVMTNEAEKYYLIVAIIMFIQLVCNGLYSYFNAKIYEENQKENYTTELVQQIGTEINESVFSLMFGTMQRNFNMFISALGIEIDKVQPEIRAITNEKTQLTNDKKQVEIPKISNPIGFIKTIENKKDTLNNNETRYNKTRQKNETRIKCKHCGNEFVKNHKIQIYCSTECRLSWHKQNDGFDISKHIKRNKKK